MSNSNNKPTFKLKIIQQNCQHSIAVMGDTAKMICEGVGDVWILQEPYMLNGKVAGLGDVRVFYIDDNTRAAIAVPNEDIDVFVRGDVSDGDAVFIILNYNHYTIGVGSIYCPIDTDIEVSIYKMNKGISGFANHPFLLGADANATSRFWHSKNIAASRNRELRGETLSEYINHNNFLILNSPSDFYTFSGPTGSSDIDITLAGPRLERDFSFNWEVCPDLGISDHNLIQVDLIPHSTEAPLEQHSLEKYKLTMDWEQFNLNRCAYSHAQFAGLPLDDMVNTLNGWVENSLKKTKVRNPRKNNAKWWTSNLTQMRKLTRKLRKEYQLTKRSADANIEDQNITRACMEAREKWKAANKRYKESVVDAKRTHWQDYVTAQTRDKLDPWGGVYKLLRGKKGPTDLMAVDVDGRVAASWQEAAAALTRTFFGPVLELPYNVETITDDEGAESSYEVTKEKIAELLRKVKGRKAPGLDGLTGSTIKKIFNLAPEYIVTIINKCFQDGIFPRQWKKAKTIILLKSPDKPKSQPRSYRPICLLPAWSKILEKLMVERLAEDIKNKERVSAKQYGFTAGKSTQDAWLDVIETVEKSESKYVLGIFIDFVGAFDNIKWEAIFAKLDRINARDSKLWRSYFRDRWIVITGRSETYTREVTQGCPQGSICGPFIWNMIMNDLLISLEEAEVKFVAYADDLLVMIEGNTRRIVEENGMAVVQKVGTFADGVGLTVSMSKSECMLLKGIMAPTRPPWIKLNNQVIKYSTQVKYLGLMVSSRLNFLPHFINLRTRLTNLAAQFRRVTRRKWGPSISTLRIWWNGVFSALSLYGSAVWLGELRKSTIRDALDRCERVVLYACLPICRTVSTPAMQAIMGELPWRYKALDLGLRYRLERNINTPRDLAIDVTEVRDKTPKEIKKFINERLQESWRHEWEEQTKGRTTYEFIKNPAIIKDLHWFQPTLEQLFIITGHGTLNKYLYDKNISDNADCQCAQAPEDWKHVLFDCPLYTDLRTWDPNLRNNINRFMEERVEYEKFRNFCESVFARKKETLVT